MLCLKKRSFNHAPTLGSFRYIFYRNPLNKVIQMTIFQKLIIETSVNIYIEFIDLT